jgi:DNA-binding GntR family transcriptional regulator
MAPERSLDDSSAYLAAPPAGTADPWTAAGGTQQLLDVAQIEPPRNVAEALDTGEPVVLRRRLMLLDGRPVEIADSYYPARVAAGTALAEQRRIPGGSPALLSALGLVAAYADEAVELESEPTSDEAALLGLRDGDAVARLFRTAYTAGGTPIEVSTSVFVRAGRVLRYRITVG